MTSSATRMPPRTGAAIGRMISDADPAGPEHRGQADDDRALGQQLGPEPMDGAVQDRLAQLVQADPLQPAGPRDGLAEVDQHDDPGRGRHAEAGDVADPDRHRELQAQAATGRRAPPAIAPGTASIIRTASARS